MKKYISALSLLVVILASCNKSFLDKSPIDELSNATAFVSYNNFQTYAWGLYDYFEGYGNSSSSYPSTFSSQEFNSDNFSQTVAGSQSTYALGTKVAPSAAATTTSPSLTIATWNFAYVRRVDVMLDHIDASTMAQSDKDHWRCVGYFFRALRYYDLLAAFGDVPWIEHSLTDTSASVLFGARTPRDSVAQNILNNLIWAESHIKVAGDGTNTINQSCVQFLLSRFGLFEGTWRKYHGLSNASTYLNACVTYSQKLIANYPTVMSSYDDVYNTEDLTGKAGIVLFKQYVAGTTINNTNTNINDAVTRYEGSTSWHADVPKSMVESYLCTDGKPISSSTVYAGDDSMYAAFRNRDRRLYFSVIPPYRVKFKNPAKILAPGYSDTLWTNDANLNYAEYINLMKALPGNTNKTLPLQAQSLDMKSGNVIPNVPHFLTYTNSLSNLPTVVAVPQIVSQLGYYYWKFYNRLPQDAGSNNTQDCPLFRIEETYLNYAEASFELGTFTQAIADLTINKLRPRANLPNMTVSAINSAFDSKRDVTVDPVLWEIRRERRIELLGDGFRFNDLKRWAKGAYFNDYQLGVKVKNAYYGGKLTIDGGGATGYVKYFSATSGWKDAYYLEPVPLQEIVINPSLTQNPGW